MFLQFIERLFQKYIILYSKWYYESHQNRFFFIYKGVTLANWEILFYIWIYIFFKRRKTIMKFFVFKANEKRAISKKYRRLYI